MTTEKLFEKVPDIVFCMKNTSGQYVSANLAFTERLGLPSVDNIIGKTAHDLFPEHLAATYSEQDQMILTQGEEISDRLELVSNRNGRLGWYLASKFPIEGKDGMIIGLASISRDLQTPGDEDLRFAGLAKVVEHIQKNYLEDLKPTELAKSADLSLTQLERRMRKIFKLSTVQFIRKTRIESAARQLIETDKTIINIALDSGYGDQSAFTRQFKTSVGMAPGAYRSAFR
ncbi:helix-turn-helix domain-containing protein [Coraliomargarita sp. W4R53]